MPQLVSVRFRYNPKALWFDPQGKTYTSGTEVLVETERGREVGIVQNPHIEATSQNISKLKSPLKPVIRELNELDYEHLDALEEKGKSAMPYFREKALEYQLDIKPVEVQYLFSGERAVFYFSSEERVDFRELVRDLAQQFHVRIDMRQIGARDEAKELGGIAHCGEEFCCTRFGGEFQPVSIRMAKEQDLPLNPSKISGVCGRLMCCLRYEYEAYKDFKKRAPKKGTSVDTPLGGAVISGYNTPKETMELKLEDGKRIDVPLAEIDCSKGKDGCTQCSVSSETIQRCAPRSILISLGALDQQLEDVLATPIFSSANDSEDADSGQSGRRRRRRNNKKDESASADGVATDGAQGAQSGAQSNQGGSRRNTSGTRRNAQNGAQRNAPKTTASRGQEASTETGTTDGSRRRRRRSTGGANEAAAQRRPQQNGESTSSSASESNQRQREQADSGAAKPRPGQNSSSLRKQRRQSTGAGSSQGSASQANTTQGGGQNNTNQNNGNRNNRSQGNARQNNNSGQNLDIRTTSEGNERKPRRRHNSSSNPE